MRSKLYLRELSNSRRDFILRYETLDMRVLLALDQFLLKHLFLTRGAYRAFEASLRHHSCEGLYIEHRARNVIKRFYAMFVYSF